ncbi:MAG: pyridoxal phosphate-dependent aminotransferase [Deltaproteobacteria bacterium]|jgi:aspartate aminotransferase|nr:pyridoxal phosphate-dependent aminotransferase [Deltaproteobacteria bacterium]
MELSYSEIIARVQPSPTLALDALAKSMAAAGKKVVNLAIGEPNFETPEHVREAAIKAIRDGFTRYTQSEGILPLREKAAEMFKKDNGLDYSPEQIVVTNGGKHALYNAMRVLFNPGDEVVIPSPYWVTYPAQVILAGAVPVFAKTSAADGWRLKPEELERVLSPKTRGIIINSPSNPTGQLYDRGELEELGSILVKRPVWIISDDIYEKLVYDGSVFSDMPMAVPELKERTVICHAVSKTYAMTGWRVGFMAAPREVARRAAVIQSQMTSNPCGVAQKAALAALAGPQECVDEMVRIFDRRRRLATRLFRDIPGFQTDVPKGAFYVFPDVSGLYGGKIKGTSVDSSDDLASLLLKECEVACVPGKAFGEDGSLRFSYAASDEDIALAAERMAALLSGAGKG